MGFFLETLFGGLMAGMLYSLIALGFVLIFKASGVFNFAQGAMVLFAALAMARFSQWIPQWTGIESKWLANVLAFIVAVVAGIIWGSKLGVQFSISLVALKALPVVILGGFTSIPGAIIGGLIIGLGEKVSEVYLGPMLGGGIENWFAYVLALIFLLFRPEGLFGERHIDRV